MKLICHFHCSYSVISRESFESLNKDDNNRHRCCNCGYGLKLQWLIKGGFHGCHGNHLY